MFLSNSHVLTVCCLLILGNIIGCKDRNFIQNIPTSSTKLLISTLNTFLSSGKRFLIKECLWLLGNLFAQDLSVLLQPGICDETDVTLILPNIANHLNSAYEIRKEVLLTNFYFYLGCIHLNFFYFHQN